ncbi:helix-turn-helix domain-containing protein [Rhodococcus pyridinivorans]|uniref:AraC family transcriptional regulator n=1 Tax=Rhodococcus pyridinivorans TaxID=103816 RepID=UPI00367AC1CB
MYRKIELGGRHGFDAMTPEAGNRTSLSVPNADLFRFEMEMCDIGSVVVSTVSMTPHRALPGTVEDADVVNLGLMLLGEQWIDAGGQRVTVSAGQILAQVGWNRHEGFDAAGSTMLLMQFDRFTLLERGVRLGDNDVVFGPDQPTLSTHALHSMAKTALRWRARNTTTPASPGVENALVELVVGLHRESSGKQADSLEFAEGLHARAVAALAAGYADQTLTPATLAERVQIPLRTLQRAFSAHDTTIAGHLRMLRTRHAVRLLEDPACQDLTVAEIAVAAGFTSSAELRRAVRVECGVTPSEIRSRPPRHPSPPQ